MTRGDVILQKMIDVSKGDIITVVGAGGKTSFINYFANYYRNKLKVLLTTTTKIYIPDINSYDKILMLEENDNIAFNKKIGVTVCGKYINEDEKIVGLDFKDLDEVKINFDLILVEGDGSKCKKLKGWKENEPVIYKDSNKTIGILDITAYNMKINEENVHRLDEFLKLINMKEDRINLLHFKDIVLSENGLFKNAIGEKILFINKVENEEYENIAFDLINTINNEKHDIKIYYGSINQNFYRYIENF